MQENLTQLQRLWIAKLSSNFCLRFDPDADVLAEAKSPDFSVSIADTTPTEVVVAANPLAITLGYFLATRDGDQVDFIWQTVTESSVAGFDLLALTEDGAVPLNQALIPSPVIDSLQPTDYRFTAETDAATFVLREVGVDGQKREYGPFELGVESGADAGPDDTEHTHALWLPLIAR